jgi:hypothetical protein
MEYGELIAVVGNVDNSDLQAFLQKKESSRKKD